ncbi:hypothetical protein GCM10028801_20800 [Nocardioides maradonensis]
MTPDLMRCVDLAYAAERSGDIAGSLEWYRAVPMFVKGRNIQLLAGLVAVGDDLPEWAWARYLAYLAVRCEDGETGQRVRLAGAGVGAAIHEPLMEQCYDEGGDPMRVHARVFGESWAFHQAATHEVGALAAYLDEFVVGRLAEQAGLARRWVDARMSGYEIGASLPGNVLRVREATSSSWTEILDLGARACAPQGWVLGRLVPSGVGDRLMFDRHPLGVTKRIAATVAKTDDWLESLADAVGRRRITQSTLLREDYELLCDVPELEILRFGTPAPDHARVLMQLREGRDEIAKAAFRVLERARRGEIGEGDSPYVAAALLNPRAHSAALRALRPDHRERWKEIAAELPEPARSRGLALAGGAATEAE